MDCATFEDRLTELLAGEIAEQERAARLWQLREHALGCSTCAGSSDLLELMELPAVERDLVEEPGEDYWRGFGPRLERRLEAEPHRRRITLAWGVAAAALLLALAGPWIVTRLTRDPLDAPSPVAVAPDLPVAESQLPEELVEIIERASSEALDDLSLAAGPWDDGLADPFAEPAAAIFGEGSLFPDPEELDPVARRKLLDWLEEQGALGGGVS